MRRSALVIVVIILLGGVGLWFFNIGQKRPHNVMLIVLDTLRADHLGVYGYERATSPNLDAFAREHLFFRHAVTAAPWTPPSLATMFTGLYPSAHGMMPPDGRDLAKQASTALSHSLETVAEYLKRAGFVTIGVNTNPWLTKEFHFDQGFAVYDYISREPASKVRAKAQTHLLDLKDSRRPFFMYLHFLDPHDPYAPPEGYRGKFRGPVPGESYPEAVLKDVNLYDGEIRYLDDELGRLFNFLKKQGLWDNTSIVIVGDHGEQFGEHGYFGHGFTLYEQELHVPLMVRVAGSSEPLEVQETVSTVDIFSTLFELAGLPVPAQAQGYSLLRPASGRAGVISEINRRLRQYAFIDQSGRKIIADHGDAAAVKSDKPPTMRGVFQSSVDGTDRSFLDDPGLLGELHRQLERALGELKSHRSEAPEVAVSAETMDQLKSLGYLK